MNASDDLFPANIRTATEACPFMLSVTFPGQAALLSAAGASFPHRCHQGTWSSPAGCPLRTFTARHLLAGCIIPFSMVFSAIEWKALWIFAGVQSKNYSENVIWLPLMCWRTTFCVVCDPTGLSLSWHCTKQPCNTPGHEGKALLILQCKT